MNRSYIAKEEEEGRESDGGGTEGMEICGCRTKYKQAEKAVEKEKQK
jgi:hypothetical protein